MEGKTIFSRRLKQFDVLTWLTPISLFYDRSTPVNMVEKNRKERAKNKATQTETQGDTYVDSHIKR